VNVSFAQGNLTSVDKGLNPGELVVTDGQDKLQAGTKVKMQTGNGQPKQEQTAESVQ
jgi:hypothetical protein